MDRVKSTHNSNNNNDDKSNRSSWITSNNIGKNNFINAIIDSGANVHVATKRLALFAQSLGFGVNHARSILRLEQQKTVAN
jgi:hypothetical protein